MRIISTLKPAKIASIKSTVMVIKLLKTLAEIFVQTSGGEGGAFNPLPLPL